MTPHLVSDGMGNKGITDGIHNGYAHACREPADVALRSCSGRVVPGRVRSVRDSGHAPSDLTDRRDTDRRATGHIDTGSASDAGTAPCPLKAGSFGATGDSRHLGVGPARRLRVRPELGDEHRQRVLRRATVQRLYVAGGRRYEVRVLCAPRHSRATDRDREVMAGAHVVVPVARVQQAARLALMSGLTARKARCGPPDRIAFAFRAWGSQVAA